jgi:hypothetical protein
MGRRLELEWILRGSGSALDVPDPTTVLDTVGYPGAPDGDAEAFLKPDTVHNAFGQDLSEADRWLIVESQRPITLSANTTPSGAAAWKTLPSWVVVGTEDRVIPPDTQRHMAERAGATITDVAGSHVSMVSHPQATIAAILALWLGHEQTSTTNIYLHADMTHKQQAIDRTKPINTKPGRYQPTDTLLATKRSDYADLIEPRKRAEQPLPTDIGITRTSAYSCVSGAMSASFGHTIVPASASARSWAK